MSRIYLGIKIFLFVVLIVFLVNIVVFESIQQGKTIADSNPVSGAVISVYLGIRGFFLNDPYFNETIAQVTEFETNMNKLMIERSHTLEKYTTDQRFYDQIFYYCVSRELTEIGDLTHEYFAPYADFKDLIIIDKKLNVIYKSGSESFQIEFYEFTNRIIAMNFKNLYGLIRKGEDPFLDFDFEVIALYDFSALTELIKSNPMPAFIYIGDTLIRNDSFSIDEFRQYKEQLQTKDEIYTGFNILKKIPLKAGEFTIGYAGVVYPSRSFISYLLLFLKLALFCAMGVFIYFIDRRVSAYLKSETTLLKKENKNVVIDIPKTAKMADEEEMADEEKTDRNLEWIEHYIGQSEHEK
ncbi:MAG: hypothetical protein A2014_09815 [Spirochaetes bacterium GWF1_49_6]|nr:MAG: hypothetical protein A2014_09815 [Spirochaetes bacterium GWF1_49_6]